MLISPVRPLLFPLVIHPHLTGHALAGFVHAPADVASNLLNIAGEIVARANGDLGVFLAKFFDLFLQRFHLSDQLGISATAALERHNVSWRRNAPRSKRAVIRFVPQPFGRRWP